MSALLDVLEEARDLGFLGPGPVADHVTHAHAFRRVLVEAGSQLVLDLGSGGGVPGLVLAVERPDLRLTLVDANLRRTQFLTQAVAALDLGTRVSVERARAEVLGVEVAWRQKFDAVVARGFGPPAVTAECAAPFLVVGGVLVVSEPPDTTGDRWPAPALAVLGLEPAGLSEDAPRVMTLRQISACPRTYPRRAPAKRPLF